MMDSILFLRLVYAANIIVAGTISFISLSSPDWAVRTVFAGSQWQGHEAIRLVGCFWLTITLLSLSGLFLPEQMKLVLTFQLLYKSAWLLVAALPALIKKQPYPAGMAAFFVVWVIVLGIWHAQRLLKGTVL